MKRVFYVLAVAVLVVAALGIAYHRNIRASAGEEKTTSGVQVKIDNFTFGPATLTVAVGTQVTWTNHDDIPHNVVQSDLVFKSKVLDTDEKFVHTFDKVGTFPYFCSLHPKMTGTIVVK